MSGIFGKLKNLLSGSWDDMIMTLVVIALALLTARMVFGVIIKQKSYASPKGAVQAVIESRKHGHQNSFRILPDDEEMKLRNLFGPASTPPRRAEQSHKRREGAPS